MKIDFPEIGLFLISERSTELLSKVYPVCPRLIMRSMVKRGPVIPLCFLDIIYKCWFASEFLDSIIL